jgi:DNA polymerase-3 subunit beta
MKVFEDIDSNITLSANENQISLKYEDIYMVSRLVNGNFPDYTNFVPKEFKTEVVVLKQDLINSLKISNIFVDKFSQVYVNIDPKNKNFEIVTKNIDIGENKNQIEAVLKGDSLSMSFNYKYIVESFQSIESDSIGIYFNDISKPVILKGINDKTFFYLVMPMNK